MLGNFVQSILALPFSSRQKQLSKARPPLDEDEFAKQILDAGGDPEAAFIVYRKLTEWTYVKGFTPYPEDDLGKVYGIAEEELDEDMILDILNSLGVPPPSKERMVAFGAVKTPLQIAQLVSLARAEA
ncbi:MAG: hypothetical protein KKH33_06815 [Alphaproteobacteria bacterium]|nr:hypothetical protein [Alphaproteobacteria bacterium]